MEEQLSTPPSLQRDQLLYQLLTTNGGWGASLGSLETPAPSEWWAIGGQTTVGQPLSDTNPSLEPLVPRFPVPLPKRSWGLSLLLELDAD